MLGRLSLIATVFIAGTAFGQCPLAFDECDQSIVGVYVAPVNGGVPLVDYNSSTLLTPASVMKAVTTAAVLTEYPGDYQWVTTVMAVGELRNRVLNGNLIIRGSGDPTIESKYFANSHDSFIDEISQGLKSAGIDTITGKVLLEKHWPDEGAVPSWELEDIPGIDGAGFYPLNFKDNVFSLEYPSLITKPYIPGLNIVDEGGANRLKFYRNSGSTELIITGRLGRKEKKATLICSMPNPIDVALYHISACCEVKGENVGTTQDTLIVASYKSPLLRDVTRSFMVRSDNLMAEAALRLMSPGRSRREALKAERNLLSASGANLINANINDGSGLSRHNTISPIQLGSILRLMASNPDYVNSFARVGKDGTVKSFMKGMTDRENFLLKSGSMTGVVAYAGYRLDPMTQKPTHVVAVIVNNAPYASKARLAIAEFLSSLKFDNNDTLLLQ